MRIHRQPRRIALTGAPIGITDQARERGRQLIGIVHGDQRTLLGQCPRYVGTVELFGTCLLYTSRCV